MAQVDTSIILTFGEFPGVTYCWDIYVPSYYFVNPSAAASGVTGYVYCETAFNTGGFQSALGKTWMYFGTDGQYHAWYAERCTSIPAQCVTLPV